MQFVTRKRDIVNFSSPQEMYDDYKNRSINGIQDYQSKMLDLYMKEGLDKSDVAIELPTGTGKTLIGLLIGEYRRRKFHERVVYVCPTKQLVYQTATYAIEKYGIKVGGIHDEKIMDCVGEATVIFRRDRFPVRQNVFPQLIIIG